MSALSTTAVPTLLDSRLLGHDGKAFGQGVCGEGVDFTPVETFAEPVFPAPSRNPAVGMAVWEREDRAVGEVDLVKI